MLNVCIDDFVVFCLEGNSPKSNQEKELFSNSNNNSSPQSRHVKVEHRYNDTNFSEKDIKPGTICNVLLFCNE